MNTDVRRVVSAIRNALSEWQQELPPGQLEDDWARGWKSARDAMVYDLADTLDLIVSNEEGA